MIYTPKSCIPGTAVIDVDTGEKIARVLSVDDITGEVVINSGLLLYGMLQQTIRFRSIVEVEDPRYPCTFHCSGLIQDKQSPDADQEFVIGIDCGGLDDLFVACSVLDHQIRSRNAAASKKSVGAEIHRIEKSRPEIFDVSWVYSKFGIQEIAPEFQASQLKSAEAHGLRFKDWGAENPRPTKPARPFAAVQDDVRTTAHYMGMEQPRPAPVVIEAEPSKTKPALAGLSVTAPERFKGLGFSDI